MAQIEAASQSTSSSSREAPENRGGDNQEQEQQQQSPSSPSSPQRRQRQRRQQEQEETLQGSSSATPSLNDISPAIHNFFYPAGNQQPQQQNQQQHPPDYSPTSTASASNVISPVSDVSSGVGGPAGSSSFDFNYFAQQEVQDRRFVHNFWRIYDDIIILSLFTQIGIVFRLASSTWFTFFDNVFAAGSPLFVLLPLNSLSCFIMGLLCSGERLMEIIATRFSPPQLQQQILQNKDGSYKRNSALRSSSNHNSVAHGGDDDDHDTDEEHDEDENSHDNENDVPIFHSDGEEEFQVQNEDDLVVMDVVVGSDDNNTNGPGRFLRRRLNRPRRRRRRRHRRRRTQREKESYFQAWEPPVHLNEELRDVQLLALERRIRASRCLVLFPVSKQDVDVMEHYFMEGYNKEKEKHHHTHSNDNSLEYGHDRDESKNLSFDLELTEEVEDTKRAGVTATKANTDSHARRQRSSTNGRNTNNNSGSRQQQQQQQRRDPLGRDSDNSDPQRRPSQKPNLVVSTSTAASPASSQHVDGAAGSHTTGDDNNTSNNTNGDNGSNQEQQQSMDQMFQDVHANVSENISRLRRINLADGWDVGTTPDDMSDQLMLGLRDGFCGALSSFSSWNSAMVDLLRNGQIGQAIVGYMLGIQLPIIAYRFGQHVAVYIFIWRCRFETKRDERRGGYGIRVNMNESSERDSERNEDDDGNIEEGNCGNSVESNNNISPRHAASIKEAAARETPSVRAIATALFIMALVTQCTSLSFFRDPDKQQLALSLLFSPLGVLARWRLSKLNSWRPTFPIGTFSCNILACAIGGSLGTLLAGNPGPRERIVLVSIVAGFGGTLSSVATFIVEVLAGVDPILYRFDGFIYAFFSVFWAMVAGFVFSGSVDWADQTQSV